MRFRSFFPFVRSLLEPCRSITVLQRFDSAGGGRWLFCGVRLLPGGVLSGHSSFLPQTKAVDFGGEGVSHPKEAEISSSPPSEG